MLKVAVPLRDDYFRIVHKNIPAIEPFLMNQGWVLNADPAPFAATALVADDERGVISEPSTCNDYRKMTVKRIEYLFHRPDAPEGVLTTRVLELADPTSSNGMTNESGAGRSMIEVLEEDIEKSCGFSCAHSVEEPVRDPLLELALSSDQCAQRL